MGILYYVIVNKIKGVGQGKMMQETFKLEDLSSPVTQFLILECAQSSESGSPLLH